MAVQDILGTNLGVPITSHTTGYLTDANNLFLLVTCDTTPETSGLENVFAPGCLLIRTDSPSFYQNTGTAASPSWTANGTGARGSQGSMGTQGSLGVTGPQGTQGTQGSQGSQGTG